MRPPLILGSFLPDAVIADILCFSDRKVVKEFSLSSPKANNFVKKYPLRFLDYDVLRVRTRFEGYGEFLDFEDLEEDRKPISYYPETNSQLSLLLLTARRINELTIYNRVVDDTLFRNMFNVNIGSLIFSGGKLHVNPELLLAFCDRLSLKEIAFKENVEVPNNILTERILAKARHISVYCSWKSELQNVEARTTMLTDMFLENYFQKKENAKLCLTGFITKFTIEGIKKYGKLAEETNDFGILSEVNELSDIISLNRKSINFCSWNGLLTLICEIRVPKENSNIIVKFEVLFHQRMKQACFSSGNIICDSYPLFRKLDEAFNNPEDVLSMNATRFNYYSIWFFYYEATNSKESQLRIKYRKLADMDESVLDKTDITLHEAYVAIRNFLATCDSIHSIVWSSFILTDDLYELLKPIAPAITVEERWMVKFQLTDENLFQMHFLKTGMFTKVKKIRGLDDFLTDEFVLNLIDRNIKFDLGDERYPKLRSQFSDDLVLSLIANGHERPSQFSVINCLTNFTSEGVKAIMKVIEKDLNADFVFQWNLGILNHQNAFNLTKMLEDLKEDKDALWTFELHDLQYKIFPKDDKIKSVWIIVGIPSDPDLVYRWLHCLPLTEEELMDTDQK